MNKAKKVINKKVAQYTQPKSNNMEAATTKAMNHQVKEPTNSNIPSKIKTEEALSNKRPAQIQSPLEEAIKDHDAGIKGNKLAVKKAYASLKELAKKQPKNLEIKAYYGSATTLLARDANSVTDKMKYALEGLKQLDEVVETSPDLILARFLRGNVCYRLPLYYRRVRLL